MDAIGKCHVSSCAHCGPRVDILILQPPHLALPKPTMAMAEPSTITALEIDDGRDPSVQEFIDNTLAALIHGLSQSPVEAHISITLKRRASPMACIINPITGALEASPRVETHRKYSWPGKTAHEAWKFSKIIPPTPSSFES
ncbi:hypothetical protein ACN42_g1551 [Penicillium freii]|uniref:Uncharacterized protein n=1 Tax=Penicillium freii TaxID=48697 RepID=A0A101MRQ9_PENFR|nr:hypothetical protein ACN42_g1551 [Penicillium freii]